MGRRACFNPHSRAGSDWPSKGLIVSGAPFQSTLPRGERLTNTVARSWSDSFQSTLPRGERLCPLKPVDLGRDVSIHTPARGATFDLGTVTGDDERFNPHSRAGSDRRCFKSQSGKLLQSGLREPRCAPSLIPEVPGAWPAKAPELTPLSTPANLRGMT